MTPKRFFGLLALAALAACGGEDPTAVAESQGTAARSLPTDVEYVLTGTSTIGTAGCVCRTSPIGLLCYGTTCR